MTRLIRQTSVLVWNVEIVIFFEKIGVSSEKITKYAQYCRFVNDVLQNQKTSPLIRKAFR